MQSEDYDREATTPQSKGSKDDFLGIESPDSGYGSDGEKQCLLLNVEASGDDPESPCTPSIPQNSARRSITSSQALRTLSLSNRSLGSNFESPGTSRQTASPVHRFLTPDRFIPFENGTTAKSERFRSTKLPTALTSQERLLRRERLENDSPFSAGGGRGSLFRRTPPLGYRASLNSRWNFTLLDNQLASVAAASTSPPTQDMPDAQRQLELYQGRVAEALNIDRVLKVIQLNQSPSASIPRSLDSHLFRRENGQIGRTADSSVYPRTQTMNNALKILNGRGIKDDFYCSTVAYSPICGTLAIGLGNTIYTRTESLGLSSHSTTGSPNVWLTCLAFSSTIGAKCILAAARSDGSFFLQATDESFPRFTFQYPEFISTLAWRPAPTLRPSKNPVNPGTAVKTEDLLIGDCRGQLYYYVVEWPMSWEVARDTWSGTISLVAKIQIHHQQICGLAWSSSGKFFTTGGNDNYCCLFEANTILRQFQDQSSDSALELRDPAEDYCRQTSRWQRQSSNETVVRHVGYDEYYDESNGTNSNIRPAPLWIYRWRHLAAIKAIAFHPWTDDIVATGGGLNDKCIHFFNTRSGATITTIAVAAQVTSLIWSPNGREIAATFGFSSQQRLYRVAVFGWPSCRLVTAVHWDHPCRIVHAIPYPRVPESRRSSAISLAKEGCILLAASDETLTFFELWTKGLKAMKYGRGHGHDPLGSESSLDEKSDVIR